MPPVDKASDLLSALWFLFVAVGIVSFIVAGIFRATRGDTWKKSLIAPMFLYGIYALGAIGTSVQGWNDILSSISETGQSHLHFLWPAVLSVFIVIVSGVVKSMKEPPSED
jgi:hypothetical protein